MTMGHDDTRLQRSEGGRQIIEYCHEAAKNIGIELINVYWVTDK